MARNKQCITVIKNVHENLQQKYNRENDESDFMKIWSKHCSDEKALKDYAKSMSDLAEEWSKNHNGVDRIQWCKEESINYFYNGGLNKILKKDERRKKHYLKDPHNFHCGPNTLDQSNTSKLASDSHQYHSENCGVPLKLLDVGSCYNPFKVFDEFETLAVDIAPANDTVKTCDFIFVPLHEQDHLKKNVITTSGIVTSLPFTYYDIVVFSLLLSYIPCPVKRWKMCEKAHQILKVNGILMVVIPDSNHENKNAYLMKHWKKAMEELGFQRVKYMKDTHLHLMIYRKVPCDHIWDKIKNKNEVVQHHKRIPSCIMDLTKCIFMPKDFSMKKEDNKVDFSENINWNELPES